MEVLNIILILVILLYGLNILWLIRGINKAEKFKPSNISPRTKFSILVPFRNEAENLFHLLNSFSKLNYPIHWFEVILIDDASEDLFVLEKYDFSVQIIKNSRFSKSPKKDAITNGIKIAKHQWIITTDADCVVPKNWLKTFDAYIQTKQPKMIAGSVCFKDAPTFLNYFQQIDFLSLQGTTIGSFANKQAFMCNGANFCYQKSFFYELNGFDGNELIASGDDVFLLQKAISSAPLRVGYLQSEEAIVSTQAQKSWTELFQQRLRWASKTSAYSSLYSKQLALAVIVMNFIILVQFVFLSLSWIPLSASLAIVLIKYSLDNVLLYLSNRYFKLNLQFTQCSNLIYPFFIITIFIFSLFGNYSWKGRKFSK